MMLRARIRSTRSARSVRRTALFLALGGLAVATAGPALASTAAPQAANLVVTTSVDDVTPAAGDTVTYTVSVANTGESAANDVVLKNLVPAGLTYVGADHDCRVSGGEGECDLGTIPVGASGTGHITARVDDPSQVRHQITTQHAENVLDLDAGQTSSQSVSCPSGYAVVDGSARVVHVDQGTGSASDVDVLSSAPVSVDTWKVSVHNGATGRTQTKIMAQCVAATLESINGSTPTLQADLDPVAQTSTLPAGHSDLTLACPLGDVPVAPGFSFTNPARISSSYPAGASSWTFGIDAPAATTATVDINCAGSSAVDASGATFPLALTEQRATATLPAGFDSYDGALTLHCASGTGIVSGYRADAGALDLGNEPRQADRVFFAANPTASDLHADGYLLCLGDRTLGADGTHAITNAFSVASSSRQTDTSDDSAATTVVVSGTPTSPAASSASASPAAAAVSVSRASASYRVACAGGSACRTTVRLVTAGTHRYAGHTVARGTVLARSTVKLAAGRQTTVHLRPTAVGKRVLADRSLRQARVLVGTRSRAVTVRH